MDIDGHDQCVGYSDTDSLVFGRNERLRHAQSAVFAQNEIAEELHEQAPSRPYFSLVYFAGLTSNESAPATEHAVAEELEGIVIRQRAENQILSAKEPLLRVVVANGGTGMAAASTVVHDLLVPLVESDPTIMGVVGFDRTVTETEDAITELGRHGIPALGTTLTGVNLDGLSPLYFQLVPDNSMQAKLIAIYAHDVHATRVTIYHPPLGGSNSYGNSLVEQLEPMLDTARVEHADKSWQTSPVELTPWCADAGSTEIAFYAGREVDFGDFLRTVQRTCGDRMPHIVADDAVSRFVAHAPDRQLYEFSGVSVSYVSMGGLVVLAGQRCVDGETGSLRSGGNALDAFCAGYRRLRDELATLPPGQRPITTWPGERVGGLYDAASMFVDAVRRTRNPTPNRSAVAMSLREKQFQGATGLIDFRGSRVDNGRNLPILTIKNIYDLRGPNGVPTCTMMIGIAYRDKPVNDCSAVS